MREWQPVGGDNFQGNSTGLACLTAPNPRIGNIGEIAALANLEYVLGDSERHIIRDQIILALDATDPDTLTAENLADARHALIEALDIVEGAE